MVGTREIVEAIFHPLAIRDVPGDAQDFGGVLALGTGHQLQRRFQPHVVLVVVPRAIDDRLLRLFSMGLVERGADRVVVVRVHELQHRAPDERGVRHAEHCCSDRRGVQDRPRGRLLGDQVGRILGDQSIVLHRLDQRILAFVQAGRESIERRGQRMDLARAGVTRQRRDPLLGGRIACQVAGERYERAHQEPRHDPDRREHDDAGQQQESDEPLHQCVHRAKRFVRRIDRTHDPVRRRDATIRNEGFAAVDLLRQLRSFDAVERAVELRVRLRGEGRLRQALPVGMHDQLAVRRHDEQIAGLAEHRLRDVAEHSRLSETDAAGQDADEAPVLGEHRCGHDEHHVGIADVGLERLGDHRTALLDRVADVRPPRRVVTAPIRAKRPLREQDAFGGEKEYRAVHRRVETGVPVEIALRGVRIRQILLEDLGGARHQDLFQPQQLLVDVVCDSLNQRVLLGDQHAHQLLPERAERGDADRGNGGEKQDRRCRRRFGREARAREPAE